jgi:hypothetical protein
MRAVIQFAVLTAWGLAVVVWLGASALLVLHIFRRPGASRAAKTPIRRP